MPEDGNRSLSYLELADDLLDYVIDMGFTHIELMPVAEHPFDGSWGYQVTNYFAPTSRFGNPDEFRHFVDRCHQRGIGVILDWVPGHFPKDAHGLAEFDGTDLYEHSDPRQGEHVDWGTLIFNYGRNEVRNFLIANGLFWFDHYHIDGLRVDAVASMLYLDYSRKAGEWIPNAFGGRENLEAIHFLKQFNEVAYGRIPRHHDHRRGIDQLARRQPADVPGRARVRLQVEHGLDERFSLRYMALEPIYRRYHQGDITFSLVYAFSEHFMLVLSHDEVVHGKKSLLDKMPGDEWQKFANLRMFLAWMWAHPGKKLIFQGGEFGQWKEWAYDEQPRLASVAGSTARRPAPVGPASELPLPPRARLLRTRRHLRGFRVDRLQRLRQQRDFLRAQVARRRRVAVHRQRDAHRARELPRRRAGAGILPGNRQHRRRRPTVAATWAIAAGCRRTRRRGRGGRTRSNLRLPPLSVIGFKRTPVALETGANVTELLPL